MWVNVKQNLGKYVLYYSVEVSTTKDFSMYDKFSVRFTKISKNCLEFQNLQNLCVSNFSRTICVSSKSS